jgi:hypothetical protein
VKIRENKNLAKIAVITVVHLGITFSFVYINDYTPCPAPRKVDAAL